MKVSGKQIVALSKEGFINAVQMACGAILGTLKSIHEGDNSKVTMDKVQQVIAEIESIKNKIQEIGV